MTDPRELYLRLMKECLTFNLWGESVQPLGPGRAADAVQAVLQRYGLLLMRPYAFDARRRALGQDWPPPPQAETMVGLARLDHLQLCLEQALAEGVPGDLIETGCWRGGASIFMRAVLRAYDVTDRTVWVADSFAGLPEPDPVRYPADAGDLHHTLNVLSVSLDEVRRNFARYGLLDDRVRFLKGWFRDTLPGAPLTHLAVMRLDGDMYESTTEALVHLYPKLSPGGFAIIDDYVLAPCRAAVHDYRAAHQIDDAIVDIDGTGAFWRKNTR